MENPNIVEDKLTKEFLEELIGKDEVSEEKITKILAEHNAYNRALVQKRNELLGSERKLKEQIATFGTEKEEWTKKQAELEEALKKASSEDNRKFYETQLAERDSKHQKEMDELTKQKDYYYNLHLNALRDKAIEEGCKNLNFVPGLKDGFIARVLATNEFEPQDVDGTLMFLNKEHHTIEDAIQAFALSQEGKNYIANPSTGGGARSNGFGSSISTSSKNPFKKETENLTEQMRLYREDRATYDRLKAEAGL